jgi:hypothetical protein
MVALGFTTILYCLCYLVFLIWIFCVMFDKELEPFIQVLEILLISWIVTLGAAILTFMLGW